MIGAKSREPASAASERARILSLRILAVTFELARNPPSFTPRALAAFSAALARSLIALAFLVGHKRHDAYGQPIGSRHVRGNEVNASLFQAKQEVRIADSRSNRPPAASPWASGDSSCRRPISIGIDTRRPCLRSGVFTQTTV